MDECGCSLTLRYTETMGVRGDVRVCRHGTLWRYAGTKPPYTYDRWRRIWTSWGRRRAWASIREGNDAYTS